MNTTEETPLIRKLWPTTVGLFDNLEHGGIKPGLLNLFATIRKNRPLSKVGKMNIRLYESEYDLFRHQDDNLRSLTLFLASSIFATAMDANDGLVPKRINPEDLCVTFVDSWFIAYDEGGFVAPHYHHNCSWSCVYYVQANDDGDEKNGSTYLCRDGSRAISYDIGSYHQGKQVETVTPKEGRVLIWPSHVMHGSYPNAGPQQKIIVSCNATITAGGKKHADAPQTSQGARVVMSPQHTGP